DGDAFVQEVTTNIDRRNIGVEAGIEYQVTPTILLKGAANVSQNVFTNNPDLYLTSQNFPGQLRFGDGTTKLEDFHVAGGPERAYQIGFEYRDPDFWWVGATLNYFSNAYVDVSRLRRSDNFTLDADGLPFVSFDENEARNLLKQEELDDYALVNLVGGKSWRIDKYFLGFFASINNLFAEEHRTGGFEQSRKGTFENLTDDVQNGRPTFGNRYFFGNGTTYYVNVYLRF
ncbi:MAG: TonB-dependent receptor, partial [Flavobacteriaceae bacterium]|nr:TonB-dependent receptor [Flavobacteriaceae bacterium]